MHLNEYQFATTKYRISSNRSAIEYGLSEEVGEVMGVLKRVHRGDYDMLALTEVKEKFKKEAGDVLWYLSQLLADWNIQLEDVARENLAMLDDRMNRGVIRGSGDR